MRMSGRCLKTEQGFSLAETMIALGIGALVMLAIAGGIFMVAKANKKASIDSLDIAEMATVGVAFPYFVAQARPSVDFLHSPVNKSCAGDDTKPCLRMESNGSYVELDSTTLGLISGTTVEFYRDHNGALRDDLKVAKSDSNAGDATLTFTSGLNLAKLPSGHTIHATWPLIDEKSAPLIMLTSNTVAKFSVPGYTALSDADPTSWVFLKLDSGVLSDVTKLVNNPMAFFNPVDTRQFVIKDIIDAHSCGDMAWVGTCNTKAGNAAYVTANDVIVKYTTISSSSLAPLLSSPIAAPSDGSFDTTYSSLSQFPNISTTINDSGAVYFSGSSYDPRRTLHYYHSNGVTGGIAALPLAIVSMRVVRDLSTNKLNLVRDVYKRGSAPIRGTVSGDLKGPALIARKLGSSEIKLILFDSSPSP